VTRTNQEVIANGVSFFNSVLAQGDLMEIKLSGRKYTWSNGHVDNPTFELLDRVIVSPLWEEHYPLVTVEALARDLSDHTPLLISTGDKAIQPATMFRFENCWLLRPYLKELVTKNWSQRTTGCSSMDIWHQKMVRMRNCLKGWNRNFEGEYKRKRKKKLLS
jgi:hypothetical protein